MAVRLSRALANAVAGGAATAKHSVGTITTIAFVDGGAGNDSITDSANGLAGFSVGDKVTVRTTSGTNNGTYTILTVAAGSLGVATGSLTAEIAATAGASSLVSHRGHSFRDIFKYSVIRLYSGTMPANPNVTEAGTYLMEITLSNGAFAGGSNTNGLLFDAVSAGVLSKDATQTWQGAGETNGTATWGRLYDNAYEVGTDTDDYTSIRLDFEVASDGSKELNMDTTISTGVVKTVDTFTITVPQA